MVQTASPILNLIEESPLWRESLEDIEQIAQQTLNLFIDEEEVSLVLVDDMFIQKLNHQYRGKDKPTNVLSFETNVEGYVGDIIMAYETVRREADEQEKSFKHHFQHLLIHGYLHLQGHDHENDEEAKIMESIEISLLSQLGIANPYEN
jgi:probable rRNA maturation factor